MDNRNAILHPLSTILAVLVKRVHLERLERPVHSGIVRGPLVVLEQKLGIRVPHGLGLGAWLLPWRIHPALLADR